MSTTIALAALALAMMNSAQPSAPWKDTYPRTSEAFAKSAHEHPLFNGDRGEEQTVALFVSVAWFESSFNPKAEGDHDCLKRASDTNRCLVFDKSKPRSFGLGQIGESNFKTLGVTKELLLEDPDVQVGAMNTMLRQSLYICRAEPEDFRVAWYAVGGEGCAQGHVVSRHRVLKAKWLFANVRPKDADFLAVDP
jgi:hypothetical protein